MKLNYMLKKRILNGISFFRTIVGEKYDAAQVRKFLPHFLNTVEEFVKGARVWKEKDEK